VRISLTIINSPPALSTTDGWMDGWRITLTKRIREKQRPVFSPESCRPEAKENANTFTYIMLYGHLSGNN
jgi:hypothetical protein